MTTTLTRSRSRSQVPKADPLGDLAPGGPARRRNWPRAGAAAALAVLSGGLFVLLYASAGHRQPFLAVAREVPAGGIVMAGDLATARVGSDAALVPIPAQEAAAVVGRRAAVTLVPGTLLTAGDLAAGPVVGTSSASVGLDLKAGEVPAGLSPGDPVLVVETNGTGSGAGQPATGGLAQTAPGPEVLVDRATVLSAVGPSASSGSGGDTEVTVEVPAALAAAVVTASSVGDVALAGLGPAGGS